MSSTTVTGEAPHPVPLIKRILVFAVLATVALELVLRSLMSQTFPRLAVPLVRALQPVLQLYARTRAAVLEHPALGAAGGGGLLLTLLILYRSWLLLWHNHIIARLTGTFFAVFENQFPRQAFDLLTEIARRPPGSTFVGRAPRRRWLGWSWSPVYLTAQLRSMHRHTLGKTGSGKTQSVLFPQVLQDVLDGKGCLVMDAKGSDENILMMKAIAKRAGREQDLKIFALPAWNQPQLATHTYNMVFVRPRTPTDRGGDPVATAGRVFSVLPLGDNAYYNTQAEVMWTNLCRLLHGMVDEKGFGLPFTMLDLAVCFKGIGHVGEWNHALKSCLQGSLDRDAAAEVESQISRLGSDVHKVFSGVIGAVDKFLAPLVNAYSPDIVFEDVLEKNQIVYVQLPANLFPLQASAMGRVMLQDVQQEGSLRQVFRRSRNQRPFAVVVDEFYNFADLAVIDSLNKLRDAHLEYTLAHQSIADLELVSKEFAVAVWDNTRTKDILNQDNPELCEKVAKSLGTHAVVEKTVRRQQGALYTSLIAGDASTKLVESYRLHPNQIKGLAPCGQGFLFQEGGIQPVAYATLPAGFATAADDYPLPARPQTRTRGLALHARFIRRECAPTGSPDADTPADAAPLPAPPRRPRRAPSTAPAVPVSVKDLRQRSMVETSAQQSSPKVPVTHFSKRSRR